MAVEMRCPNCNQVYGLTDEQAPQYAGRTITCTSCGKPFVAEVPGYAAPAAQPPPLASPHATPQSAQQTPGLATPGYETPERFHQPQRTNGLAIASLVSGVLGFVVPLVPGLLAIILGDFGLRKTRDPWVGGRCRAIALIVLGAVILLFSLLLVTIRRPSRNGTRHTSKRIKSARTLRQIGMAAQMYANENKGALPPDFATILKTQDLTPHVFVCPRPTTSTRRARPSGSKLPTLRRASTCRTSTSGPAWTTAPRRRRSWRSSRRRTTTPGWPRRAGPPAATCSSPTATSSTWAT